MISLANIIAPESGKSLTAQLKNIALSANKVLFQIEDLLKAKSIPCEDVTQDILHSS